MKYWITKVWLIVCCNYQYHESEYLLCFLYRRY